jgi:co-chaperonin GroES (HSP10)
VLCCMPVEYGGQAVKLEGEEYSLFREDDILGIMQD